MAELNRREFVTIAAAAAAGWSLFREAPWAVAGEAPAAPGPFDAGPVSDYGQDGITDKFAKPAKFLIVRRGGVLYALSAICTHRRCTVKAQGSDRIACPCHGSRFAADGAVAKGPARTALPRHPIFLKDNHVIVDTSRTLSGQSSDSQAQIKVT